MTISVIIKVTIMIAIIMKLGTFAEGSYSSKQNETFITVEILVR